MEDNLAHNPIHDHPIFRNLIHLQPANKTRDEPANEYVGKQDGRTLRSHDRIKIKIKCSNGNELI